MDSRGRIARAAAGRGNGAGGRPGEAAAQPPLQSHPRCALRRGVRSAGGADRGDREAARPLGGVGGALHRPERGRQDDADAPPVQPPVGQGAGFGASARLRRPHRLRLHRPPLPARAPHPVADRARRGSGRKRHHRLAGGAEARLRRGGDQVRSGPDGDDPAQPADHAGLTAVQGRRRRLRRLPRVAAPAGAAGARYLRGARQAASSR